MCKKHYLHKKMSLSFDDFRSIIILDLRWLSSSFFSSNGQHRSVQHHNVQHHNGQHRNVRSRSRCCSTAVVGRPVDTGERTAMTSPLTLEELGDFRRKTRVKSCDE